jgi:hypothetical protein
MTEQMSGKPVTYKVLRRHVTDFVVRYNSDKQGIQCASRPVRYPVEAFLRSLAADNPRM